MTVATNAADTKATGKAATHLADNLTILLAIYAKLLFISDGKYSQNNPRHQPIRKKLPKNLIQSSIQTNPDRAMYPIIQSIVTMYFNLMNEISQSTDTQNYPKDDKEESGW